MLLRCTYDFMSLNITKPCQNIVVFFTQAKSIFGAQFCHRLKALEHLETDISRIPRRGFRGAE